MNFDTLIFDLDGTLLDASPDIAAATNYILRQIGWPELPVETVASYIGGGAEALWRRVLGDQADTLMPTVLQPFIDRYAAYPCVESSLYPGAPDLLQFLQSAGVRMAIATQKGEKITANILKELDIAGYFSVVVGPESVSRRKPDPESVLLILDRLRSQPHKALMIGDTAADILAGRSAMVHTCAVTYGYGRKAELEAAQPDYVISQLLDLRKLLG